MIVAAHQPQYLPWLGYYDKIDRADAFVLLDTVQFKKNEWQNRNRIKTAAGPQWLTVPVTYTFPQRIDAVGINNRERWQHKQRQAIVSNYRHAPCWDFVAPLLEEILSRPWEKLAPLNIFVVKKLAERLGITTPLYVASELPAFPDDPDERLIAIAKHFGADTYLAGAGGHGYMDLDRYERNGIKVLFQKYDHPVYEQKFGGFEPFLSVLDLLFNHGPASLSILRGKK
ncbi:MAG: WbqC family protein [Deltaproteobacteria bacterium]|nr:WbqC family protein [Deltaproteobacteria bacterium]